MKTNRLVYAMLIAVVVGCGFGVSTELKAQSPQATAPAQMTITGEIALMPQGYIIRGKAPAEIFTILNPVPEVLDKISSKGKDVEVLVRIVSGDNIEIVKIDGKDYP